MSQKESSIELKFEDDLKFEITSEVVNDVRFLELFDKVQEEETKAPQLLKFLIGDAAYDGIFEYYKKKDQRFTITKMGEVFEQFGEELNKNPDFLRQ